MTDPKPKATKKSSVDRRDFIRVCTMALAAVGMPYAAAAKVARTIAAKKLKPSVIWLHFQECTGCTESLLRTSHPALSELILDLVSLDYHETLFAAAGHQAEAALQKAMKDNAGKYVLVIEGAIPTKENGIYCQIGGRTAMDIANDVAAKAGAIIAIGSCASWGGIPSADPNPTGATGAPMFLKGKTVVTIPGCPANPYNFLGTVLQYATYGTLPELDEKNRPKFAYGRTIHEHCPRRAHFDAGRFAEMYGDAGHREGYCLYKLGCKGPATYANCSVLHFGENADAWPIGIGHPCYGCTEQSLAFRVPMHTTVDIERPMPPDTYPPIRAKQGSVSPVATGIAGVIGGALVGAGFMASRKMRDVPPADEKGEGSGA
jgi:hydrogenase small subunit